MKQSRILVGVTAVIVITGLAQPPKLPSKGSVTTSQSRKGTVDSWKDYRFLIGEWSGQGLGPAGQGPGTMTVEMDLDESILRVNNLVSFASDNKKTNYSGTMIVSKSHNALFLDNEGHVLHYTARAGNGSVTFLMVPEANAPRFRMVYQALGSNKLKSAFDVAPMDTPTTFKIHVTGEATKQ